MAKLIAVVLIGHGFLGRVHSNVWRQVKHFYDFPFETETTLLCGRESDTLVRNGLPWKQTTTDWRDTINRPDID